MISDKKISVGSFDMEMFLPKLGSLLDEYEKIGSESFNVQRHFAKLRALLDEYENAKGGFIDAKIQFTELRSLLDESEKNYGVSFNVETHFRNLRRRFNILTQLIKMKSYLDNKKEADGPTVDGDMVERMIKSAALNLQKRTGLPVDFLEQLTAGDDWSFVVKGHALLEAAFNDLLLSALGRKSMDDFIVGLQIGGRHGKLAMASDMGLMPSLEEKAFVKCFSEIRNRCVHKVIHAFFSFTEHIGKMNRTEYDKFYETVTLGRFLVIEDQDFRSDPKLIMMAALEAVIGHMSMQAILWSTHKAMLKAYLMCKPDRVMQQALWELAKKEPVTD